MTHASTPDQLDLLWFCQLAADGEFIGTKPERRATLPYISSLVETAAEMGFSSLLTATNFHAEHEAWTASIATLARTQGAGLLIAVRPGMFHPALFAKMVATAANLFPGRVRVNVVTGSNPAENAMYGDMENHAERYARTREFIAIMRELWQRRAGRQRLRRCYPFKGAIVSPVPPHSGSDLSRRAQRRCAADFRRARGRVSRVGRYRRRRRQATRDDARAGGESETPRRYPLTYGLRCHVVVRETEEEAWKRRGPVDQPHRSGGAAEVRRDDCVTVDSEGQRRQLELAASASLVVEPNLWSGVGLARSGVGVAIVGDPAQVAAKLRAYQALGISTFILSGYPHLEECRRFGEMVMPILRRRATPEQQGRQNGRAAGLAEGVAPVT